MLPPVSSSFPSHVHVSTCLSPIFLSLFISPSITITLSRSHFSACDHGGSEFSSHVLLLLCPQGCSEGRQKGKAGERDLMGCCLTSLSPPGRSGEGNREPNGNMRKLKTHRSLAGCSGPQQTSGDNKPPRKDSASGANQTTPLQQLSCAQTIASLHAANSAKVRATAEPTSAQINQHTHAPCDGSHPQHHHRAFGAAGSWPGQGSAHQAHAAQILQSGEQGCTP